MTSSDFLSITPWVSALKANCPYWHEKKEHFLVWVFALVLTACGYWENFSNGSARSGVGCGEQGSLAQGQLMFLAWGGKSLENPSRSGLAVK